VIYAACRSVLHWTHAKKRLAAFCTVIFDCDGEGTLRLHNLPTSDQANTIRDVLGIRKRVEYDPEQLEMRRTLMARARSAQGRANATVPLPLPTPKPNADFSPAARAHATDEWEPAK
jgi:hypothetical protein